MKKYRHKIYKHIVAEEKYGMYLINSGINIVDGEQYKAKEHTVPAFMIEYSQDREPIEELDCDKIQIEVEDGKTIFGAYGYKDGRGDIEYDITDLLKSKGLLAE